MDRFSFAANGSAQASWKFCPTSRLEGGMSDGGGGGGQSGTYQQQKHSVSGYVNGYNPSLPAYPPTRAQIEAAAKRGTSAPGAGQGGYASQRQGSGGYSGEIADQMSAQIAFEKGGGRAGGGAPVQTQSSLSETSGGLTYSGHGAWDGPAPAGDSSKPAPGTPYYVNTPVEPVFDKTKEEIDLPLGTAGNVVGRVPMLGVCASALADLNIAKLVTDGTVKHIACPCVNSEKSTEIFALVKQTIQGVDGVFVSFTIAPTEARDPGSAVDAALTQIGAESFDLVTLQWPIAGTLETDWQNLESLVTNGKCKAIGLANASVPIVEAVCKFATVKPAANVLETHPLMAHRKLVGVCRRYGVCVMSNCVAGNGNDVLMKHPKLLQAAALAIQTGSHKSREALLARWSTQRGVPIVFDATSGVDAGTALDFRLTNAQKVLVDAMEPPPREGGIRFAEKPAALTVRIWPFPNPPHAVCPYSSCEGTSYLYPDCSDRLR